MHLTELFQNEFGSLIGDIEKDPTEWKDVCLMLITHKKMFVIDSGDITFNVFPPCFMF